MIERTFHTPGSLRLDLTIPAGSIEVETTDGEETHVELDADREGALDDARVELREHGDGHELVVDIERRRLLGGLVQISVGGFSVGDGDYRLRVRCPHGATLAVRTASADVDARGSYTAGDVKTASGDVRLGEVDGRLAVKTVSGDVRVRRVGDDLTAQLVSGDLAVADAGAGVKAKTVSGDVRLTVANGAVEVVSVSGDVEVGVRRGSRLRVDANSVSGDLDSEVPLADAPGGGESSGPLVDLRAKTVSGDFSVRRADAAETHPA